MLSIKTIMMRPVAAAMLSVMLASACSVQPSKPTATLNELEYFEFPGVNVLVFSNPPGGMFFDAKTSGIEIIHHGERTATNGDVRLLHAPEQWDGMAELVERRVDQASDTVITKLAYPEHDFSYEVRAKADGDRVLLSVHLDKPLPENLEGRAGFNLEFLPSAYWGKSYLADEATGYFPRSAIGPMLTADSGLTEPTPFAKGNTLVLAPEDPEHRVAIRETTGKNELMLFDGRTKAQNGWYVVRSLLPAEATGKVIEWELEINSTPGWVREPVIGYSQVGYHPNQPKKAVIELDKNHRTKQKAKLVKVKADGTRETVLSATPTSWGKYLRYQYLTFDFTTVSEPGLYELQYGGETTEAFRIDESVYAGVWQPTLDVFFPVQMDHMRVREAYRVWHGASHLDDALQAPSNYEHFDLYAHDANTDSKFKTFEHIPGLNVGGWYDAGDYDIRTQSQYDVLLNLVHAYEQFGIDRDNTTISQDKRYTEIHRPDGKPDILQQIEHGTLALIAQHRALGHAIPGIVAGRLYQYPHLGDGSTKSDNMIYDPKMDPHGSERKVGKMYEPSTVDPTPAEKVMPDNGKRSGRFDDRWAFTSNTSALNYGSAAALTAASRVLRGYNDALAKESLETAKRVWKYETGREPNLYHFGNTTGGKLEDERLKAAVELLITTQEPKYAEGVRELLPKIKDSFSGENVVMLVRALPYMDESYAQKMEALARQYRAKVREFEQENPYGVPITRFGWAGAGTVVGFGVANYWLNKAFPDIVEEDLVYRSLDFIFGTHPDSNYSFVSGVGPKSQTNAYGNNRADFSFIPGGIVPGVLVLPPDYPENKSDWPFFWGQNEYVITVAGRYIFLANAAQSLLDAK